MAQTFHFVTPVECTPGTASAWTDVDLDTYVASLGADVTGVLLHSVMTRTDVSRAVGFRKNGSTDARISTFNYNGHNWTAIGVDATHIFEAYVGSITEIDVYIVGYTTTGVTFPDNGTVKTPASTGWQDMDCSALAAGATGLIFDIESTSGGPTFGVRCNGSTDNRVSYCAYHQWAFVKCDAGQIAELSQSATGYFTATFIGYITDGVTWQTNAIDRSLTDLAAWTNITVTAGGGGAIIEVHSGTNNYGLRDDGSAEAILQPARLKCWGVIKTTSDILEGQIANTATDFWEHGICEAAAAGGWANISPIRMGTGEVLSADIEKFWFGTSAVLAADIEKINGATV